MEVPSTDLCRDRTLSTALTHVFAWLWTCQDSAVLLVSCSLPIPPLHFMSKTWTRQDPWAGMCKPLQPWISHARLFQPHAAPGFVLGSLLQQVPSEPQLCWCLSSAARGSFLPSVAGHPAKLCPGPEMTKCPLVNCRTDRLELKVLIYMTMALTAQ